MLPEFEGVRTLDDEAELENVPFSPLLRDGSGLHDTQIEVLEVDVEVGVKERRGVNDGRVGEEVVRMVRVGVPWEEKVGVWSAVRVCEVNDEDDGEDGGVQEETSVDDAVKSEESDGK